MGWFLFFQFFFCYYCWFSFIKSFRFLSRKINKIILKSNDGEIIIGRVKQTFIIVSELFLSRESDNLTLRPLPVRIHRIVNNHLLHFVLQIHKLPYHHLLIVLAGNALLDVLVTHRMDIVTAGIVNFSVNVSLHALVTSVVCKESFKGLGE